ncbi:peptidylprolyl isomerase [Candidatus Uhrbacteria bacterium]|nr:peptidylprolyl isomerase [Candidatus Uhrbacteria bacterium]
MEETFYLDDLTAVPTSFPGLLPVEERAGAEVIIHTNRGNITVALEGTKTPKTVSNFLALAKTGFYEGLTFHRREEGFVIQGGDPNGDGTGGPGYTVDAEIVPELKHEAYVIAAARKGDQVNPTRASSGSQFYITLDEAPFLDGAYTVFGRVTAGKQVVDKIQVGDVITSIEIKK